MNRGCSEKDSWNSLFRSFTLSLPGSLPIPCPFLAHSLPIAHTHRYTNFFTSNSTLTLPPAGKYSGIDSIKEYVKFTSPDSPFIDSSTLLPGAAGYLKGVNVQGECVFNLIGHRRYVASAAYARTNALHVASMVTLTYHPATHKINAIYLFYEDNFMQYFFDMVHTRKTAQYVCDMLQHTCPDAGVDIWKHNKLKSKEDCVARYEKLNTFDDGPKIADSKDLGGGFDGNSASCRALHSVLASISTDHCAHLSFVPMADPNGNVKCQTSKRLHMTDYFDARDFENFNLFKEAAGYPLEDGFKDVDLCLQDVLRQPIPRFPRGYVAANHALPPLEYIPSYGIYGWVMNYTLWVSVLILGFGSEYIVGHLLTRNFSADSIKTFYMGAQLTFPLFLTIALVGHTFSGLLFLVVRLSVCDSGLCFTVLLLHASQSLKICFLLFQIVFLILLSFSSLLILFSVPRFPASLFLCHTKRSLDSGSAAVPKRSSTID